jgi:RecA-family ATPase
VKLVADNEGPKPGDLDQWGNPIEEREYYDPYEHFGTLGREDDWTPPPDTELDDRPVEDRLEGDNIHALDQSKLLDLIDPSEWADCPRPVRKWLLDRWIPAKQMTYFTGDGGAGKSLTGQQLATCVAMGRPFLGVATSMTAALYLTCEDDYEELHCRQKDICAGLGMTIEALHGRLHLMSLMGALGNELATFKEDGTMRTSPAWDRLLMTIRVYQIGFLVLDNVAHLFTGNENIRNQVAAFCGLLNKLASETGCTVLLIGHPNKMGAEYSGSTAWTNQVRSRLFLEVPTVMEDGKAVVLDTDARQISRAKANYAQKGETIEFRWHQGCFKTAKDMPKDEFDEQVADCKDATDERIFMELFRERRGQNRPVSAAKNSADYAPKAFFGTVAGRKIGKKRFELAMERLFAAGKISIGQVGEYANRNPKMGIIEVGRSAQSAQSSLGEYRTKSAQSAAQSSAQSAQSPQGASAQSLHTQPPLDTTYRRADAPPPGAGGTSPDIPDLSETTPPELRRAETDPWENDQ